MIWRTSRGHIDFTQQAHAGGVLMGILNTTPDSFSDGGLHFTQRGAVDEALKMVAAGAGVIDVGGESTRPGASHISAEEELERTVPVIQELRERSDVLISIDTSKSVVAAAALDAGADIVNDVSGLRGDDAMVQLCASAGCGVVVMHMQGTPRTMQKDPHYKNGVSAGVESFFKERYKTLTEAGIDASCLCFDPGIGFGKTVEQNIELLTHLAVLQNELERPILLGVSRKSLIGSITGISDPLGRDRASSVMSALAYQQGVLFHRVHDVASHREALQVASAMRS